MKYYRSEPDLRRLMSVSIKIGYYGVVLGDEQHNGWR